MAKNDYSFNPETLSYDRIQVSFKKRLWSFIGRFFQVFTMAIVIFVLISFFFDSPKEKILRREKEEILAQYQLLNNQIDRLDEVLRDLENRDDNIYRVIFESAPIDSSIRRAGTGGMNRYEALKDMDNAELVINTTRKLDELGKAIYIQSKSYDEIETLARNKIELLASIPAILPISMNSKSVRFSSSYGYRIHPIYKTVKLHEGMDFSGPVGTPIYATGNGRVGYAEVRKGYGKCIMIDHGFNYQTVYAHLDGYNVRKGQKVKRGDIIGYLGNTGRSTGPHVHYEVRKKGIAVNPINYYFNDLTAEEYDQFVKEANDNGQSMD